MLEMSTSYIFTLNYFTYTMTVTTPMTVTKPYTITTIHMAGVPGICRLPSEILTLPVQGVGFAFF